MRSTPPLELRPIDRLELPLTDERSLSVLMAIVSAGGRIRCRSSARPHMDLMKLAYAARAQNGLLIVTIEPESSTEELVELVRAGGSHIEFEERSVPDLSATPSAAVSHRP